LVEHEAATRPYGPGQAPPGQTARPDASAPEADYPAPDTARLYRPPAASSYPVPQPGKSRTALWVTLALLGALMIGGMISAIMIPPLRARPPARATYDPAERIADDIRRRIEEEVRRAQEEAQRAQEEAARAQEEAQRAQEEAARAGRGAPPPPVPPPPGGAAPQGLEQFKYPHATAETPRNWAGNQILRMRTVDDIDEVREFYQKLLGPPLVEGMGKDEVVFQSSGPPLVLVVIKPDEHHPDQLQIVVLRSHFRIPKVEIR
jgi:hypothetical protein